MLRKLERPSCVLVAENHKNLVREVRKFDAGGGGCLPLLWKGGNIHHVSCTPKYQVLSSTGCFQTTVYQLQTLFYLMYQPRRTVSTL